MAKCASNLRSIGMAYMAYAADHKGRLPLQTTWILYSSGIPQVLLDGGYADSKDIFFCPAEKRARVPVRMEKEAGMDCMGQASAKGNSRKRGGRRSIMRASRVLKASLLLAFSGAVTVMAQGNIWDVSTEAGFQNGNGTWGSDNYWTTGGTSLGAFSGSSAVAYFGGNNTAAASPTGDFTVTVSGTQQASGLGQAQYGAGNYTLTGGTVDITSANGIRVRYGTMTVNSALTASSGLRLYPDGTDVVLAVGGNNASIGAVDFRGVGTVKLGSATALGTSGNIGFTHSGKLDLNGYSVSGKTMSGVLAYIDNTSSTAATWSGNISNTGGVRAGGTVGEVELSGVVSVGGELSVLDGGTLRLSGANTHTGNTTVRDGGTLIVNNAAALGSTAGITYVQTGSVLDLNGFNVGTEGINLQKANAELLNNGAGAATADGALSLSAVGQKIGGSGNLTLGGVISGANGFEKAGAGTLTLSGNNTYAGTTAVSAGGLIIAGAHTGGDTVTVDSGAWLGGDGSMDSSLVLSEGAGFLFSASDTLTVNGATVDLGNLGVVDLIGLDGSVAEGTYTLMDGAATFDFADVVNLGAGNAYDLGGGKSAYFQEGSLQLVVIPEPATLGLLAAAFGGLLALRRMFCR